MKNDFQPKNAPVFQIHRSENSRLEFHAILQDVWHEIHIGLAKGMDCFLIFWPY